VSIFSWVAFGILLDFTADVSVYFHPLYKRGKALLSRLPTVAKLYMFFELATWGVVIRQELRVFSLPQLGKVVCESRDLRIASIFCKFF